MAADQGPLSRYEEAFLLEEREAVKGGQHLAGVANP
jgi:hypothetical protein